ncbi:hypothetical protein ACKKBF_B02645 [Auxenochlorella protothecoides x Auxenochlorella symbiontica]
MKHTSGLLLLTLVMTTLAIAAAQDRTVDNSLLSQQTGNNEDEVQEGSEDNNGKPFSTQSSGGSNTRENFDGSFGGGRSFEVFSKSRYFCADNAHCFWWWRSGNALQWKRCPNDDCEDARQNSPFD